MAQIVIIDRKCTGCGICEQRCPFQAISLLDGKPEISEACRVCGICLKQCPQNAMIKLEAKADQTDKSSWKDILVFAEVSGGRLHPVVKELIGEAGKLAAEADYAVKAVILGEHVANHAEALRHYGVSEVYVYDDHELSFFRADAFAACVEDCINSIRPSIVLVGATALGRSLAPRLSTRFHTGLTADCTKLALRSNSDLVQIRPAFGGNIMAQIVTPHTRPQFATVRYKVMDAPQRSEAATGVITMRALPDRARASTVRHVRTVPVPKSANISDADVLVVGGRGLEKESDLDLVRNLASLLGGEYAVTRPLAERGWATNLRQIGLSGRTVRPKLIITVGVSGAIQFTSCMCSSETIIAINSDPEAPIFRNAHIGIVGDLYSIVPELIERIKADAAGDAQPSRLSMASIGALKMEAAT